MEQIPEWVRKAQVGDKVICITDFSVDPRSHGLRIPLMHGTYTIREIGIAVDNWGERFVSFKVKEIVNIPLNGKKEVMFTYTGFRPSEPHAKAMDVLRKIAKDPKKYGVPAPTAKEIFLQVV